MLTVIRHLALSWELLKRLGSRVFWIPLRSLLSFGSVSGPQLTMQTVVGILILKNPASSRRSLMRVPISSDVWFWLVEILTAYRPMMDPESLAIIDSRESHLSMFRDLTVRRITLPTARHSGRSLILRCAPRVREADWGGYSRITINDDGMHIRFLWEAMRVNAAGTMDRVAFYTRSYGSPYDRVFLGDIPVSSLNVGDKTLWQEPYYGATI